MVTLNPISLLLNLVSPPRCVRCRLRGAWLCRSCEMRMPLLDEQRCGVCASPGLRLAMCADCYRDRPPIDAITAPYEHRDIARTMTLNLKYRGHRHLASVLAPAMVRAVETHRDMCAIAPTVIVAVPLHADRRRDRGFNQAELLARDVAKGLNLPIKRLLTRTRATPPQAGTSRASRIANVKGAFKAHVAASGEVVLLVDDVCTTGATLFACAAALSQVGATHIYGVTATRAST